MKAIFILCYPLRPPLPIRVHGRCQPSSGHTRHDAGRRATVLQRQRGPLGSRRPRCPISCEQTPAMHPCALFFAAPPILVACATICPIYHDIYKPHLLQRGSDQGPSDDFTLAKGKAAKDAIDDLRLVDERAVDQELIGTEPRPCPPSSITALTEVNGQLVVVPLHGEH